MREAQASKTIMPPERAKVGQDVCEVIGPMVHQAFADIIKMPGEAAELEDDALSAVATIAAHVAAQFFALLVLRKQMEWSEAWAVTVVELQTRLRGIIAEAQADAEDQPETLQ